MTATRAILAPRRFLIRLNQLRIVASNRRTLITAWFSRYRTILLPRLVIDPSRCVASPELRQPGVRPKKFARLSGCLNRLMSPIRG